MSEHDQLSVFMVILCVGLWLTLTFFVYLHPTKTVDAQRQLCFKLMFSLCWFITFLTVYQFVVRGLQYVS